MATKDLLTRRVALLAKAEAVPGTPESMNSDDGKFLLISPQMTPEYEVYDRVISRDTLSPVPSTITRRVASLTFQLEVRRSNTGNTPDDWASVLLPACGMKQTLGGSSVIYAPSSEQDDHHTLTMAFNDDGYEVVIAGAMGTVEISGTTGEVMLMSFTFQGFVQTTGDEALPSIAHEKGVPYPFQGIDLAYATGTRFVLASNTVAATGGTYEITVNGEATVGIAFDDDGTATALALDALFGSGSTTVTMLEGVDLGDTNSIMEVVISSPSHKTVAFDDTLVTGPGGHEFVMAATVVRVTSDAVPATAGSFSLTFNQNVEASEVTIQYDDTAAEIETAVDLSSLFSGSRAMFTVGADLSDANANVWILCNPVSTSSSIDYHVGSSVSGLTGNTPVIVSEVQEVVTGDDICVDNVTINLNNDVQYITCANNNSGVTRFSIVSRAPTISLNPQLTLDADADGLAAYWDHLSNEINPAISLHAGNFNGQDSNVAFGMHEVSLTSLSQDDRNGIAVVTLEGTLTSLTPGGDDELLIVLT